MASPGLEGGAGAVTSRADWYVKWTRSRSYINRPFLITLLACPQLFPFLRVTKMVFLILVFSLGMVATFLKRLGSASPVSGASPTVPTSVISPNLFKMFARGVGSGKAIVMAVSHCQEPTICSIRD